MTFGPLSPEERGELLEIVRRRSVRTGQFTLTSGRTSTLYVNLKPTMMDPRGGALAARALLALARDADAQIIGGLEMGAVPAIGAMAALSGLDGGPLPALFLRKQTKGHGTNALIEGLAESEAVATRNVFVIDDVATSGGSILQAANMLREAGARVERAAVLVDRQEGAVEALAGKGIALASVFTAADVT